VADKRQKIKIKERILSWRSGRSKRRSAARGWNWLGLLKVAAVIGLLVGAGAFLRYAEGYVRSANAGEEGSLILVDVPGWVNWDLKVRVAEMAGANRFPVLNDETAAVVARNLAPMAWLDDVNVQVTHNSVRVKARWRKPLALVVKGVQKFYVDADLVVLDYMPMPHLSIVEVKGVVVEPVPRSGEKFDREDLGAAVALTSLLHRMDLEVTPKTPLLEQIASIDVSNYSGRKQPGKPHIVLNTKGDTQVWWGAEIHEWAKHLEARDEDKLAKLYTYYMKHGSLSTGVKYIDVREPQGRVSLPIDKY
jgi:hypothetical protein